ncbi:ExeM/NucH family extracellular endonuclease [Gryllotalpicola reticulitermitis]|uniref:ExeM/NucH family extracellular endonuclease n=1 Tax=Gryllotalpicola reticulitermitis TaxID=1184153 RepID=A0ABV8Q8B2_9MICO
MPSVLSRRFALAAITTSAACLLAAGLSAPALANTSGTGLVISEAYVNGGSSGASYQNKFVELYNPTSSAIALGSDTLQYRAPTSTVTPSGSQVFALSGSVASHGYFLIQLPGNGASSNPGAALPTPDLSTGGSINPGAGGGTLFVAASSTGVQPTDASVIDKIGWGTSNSPEGTAASGNSLTLSYQRDAAGTDTDNNAADFTAAAPTPENSGSTSTGPGSGGTTPPANGEVSIADIQGTTDTSPYANQSVTTQGVVTADYATGGFNGFYLETGGAGGTAADDKTPGESDAVFVYGTSAAKQVTIGESVTVSGTVEEYDGETEIDSPTVTELATPLPAVVPDQLPWSDLTTDAQKEAHEGELVAPQGDFTVSDNYDANWYGSFTLAAGDTPLRQPTDAGAAGSAAAEAVAADNAARTITLDDGSSWNYSTSTYENDPLPWLTPSNPVRVGSAVTFHSPVVLDYRYDLWNFQPTSQVTDDGASVATFSDTRATNQQPADVGGATRLATFNVENYFPMTGEKFESEGLGTCTYYTDRQGNRIAVNTCTTTDGGPGPRGAADDANFQRQQEKIVTGINRLGASIVSLEEIENSAKFGEPRDTALAGLVDALNTAAGSDVWAYVPSPSTDALPPLATQDVIRTAFIYKPADVSPVGASQVLADQSGDGQPFSIAREPLAQQFKAAGAHDSDEFLVVANHWKSKSGDASDLYPGDDEDTSSPAVDQGAFNATRVHEAEAVNTWVNSIETPGQPVFLVGDFNSYTQEDPMQTLYSAGYTDLGSTYDPTEQTYSYNGLEGSLDHVLANAAALKLVTGADVWQINAQESVAFDYSRYNYNVTQLFDGTNPFAASDHDPVVVGLNPQTAPAAPTLSFTTPTDGATVTGTIPVSVSLAGTSLQAYNLRVDSAGLQYAYQPQSGTETFQLDTTALSNGVHTLLATATDAAGAKTTITEKITVDNPTLAWVSPTSNSTVSGTVPVSVALGGTLQAYNLRVDSAGLQYVYQPKAGTQTFQLDTTTLSNGTHTLLATATNAAGTKVTITETITVNNAPFTTTTVTILSNDKPAKVEVDVVASSSTQAIKGTAKVTIYNPDGTTKTDKSASLKNGSVTIDLPSGYKTGEYTLVAEYEPGSGGGPASTSKPVTWSIS